MRWSGASSRSDWRPARLSSASRSKVAASSHVAWRSRNPFLRRRAPVQSVYAIHQIGDFTLHFGWFCVSSAVTGLPLGLVHFATRLPEIVVSVACGGIGLVAYGRKRCATYGTPLRWQKTGQQLATDRRVRTLAIYQHFVKRARLHETGEF